MTVSITATEGDADAFETRAEAQGDLPRARHRGNLIVRVFS